MTTAGSRWTLSALLALTACSAPAPGAETAAPADAAEPNTPARPSLFGQWRIVEVDGAPARSIGSGLESQPRVSFEPGRYEGSTGCNGFGGTGLLLGDRWFADPPMATQQGCGDLTAQESAIFGILAGGPTIDLSGSDEATLRAAGRTLRLRRVAAALAEAPKPAPLLAGTRWDLRAIDGVGIELPRARVPARLTFEADAWTLDAPCAARTGGWRQEGGALLLEPGTVTAKPCPAGLTETSNRLVETVGGGRMRFATGFNGELVLTDGRHWLTGGRDTTFDGAPQSSLSGRWRVTAVDGRAPPAAERPAELAFGPGAFAIWDGCRHSEGVAIVEERQLFALGSGMVTMANCPDDPIRTTINAVVAAEPRIAAGRSGLALVSRAGTLRLQRSATQPFGTGVETRLRSGLAFDLAGAEGASARLTLGPGDRFTVALACGSFDGRWRNDRARDGAYARFGPERPPAGCGEEPGPAAVYNFFTGDVRAAIGPNRDIALFVNRGQRLVGRPVSGAGR